VSDTYRVAHLDDLDRIPVDGGQEFSLTWLRVRRSLGIRAFGTNAFVAESAGDHVVEPHTELARSMRSSTSSPAAGRRSRSVKRRSTLRPAPTCSCRIPRFAERL